VESCCKANDLPEECDDEAIGGPVTIDKKWHHCVGTFDGKEIKIYGDGKLRKELPCKGPLKKEMVICISDVAVEAVGGSMDS